MSSIQEKSKTRSCPHPHKSALLNKNRTLWFRTLSLVLLLDIIFSSVVLADDSWARVKKKPIKELKTILHQLNITYDDDMDDDDIRSLAYDENALEQWLDLHPLQKKQLIESERKKQKYIEEMKATQEQKDFSHVKDPERRALLERIRNSGIRFDGAESKPTEQLKMMVNMLNDGTLEKLTSDGASKENDDDDDDSDGNGDDSTKTEL